MRKTKKILALLLSLVMIVALAACGGTTPAAPAATTAAPAATTAAPATPAAPAATPAAPAPEAKTLKIGILAHETGWFSIMDLNNIYEAKSYASLINDEGGFDVGGTKYKIDLVVVDGKSENDAIRSGAIKLADEGVKFVIETNDFWVIGAQDIFEQEGMMHINSYPVGVPVYGGPDNPHAFIGMNGVIGDYVTTLEALKKNFPDVKTLVLANDDNGSSEASIALLQSLAPQYGITVMDKPILFPGSTVDVTALATKLKATGADAFISQGSLSTIAGIVKELRNMGNNMVAAAAVGQPASSFIKIAGEAASNRAFTLGLSPDEKDNTPLTNKLIAKVKADYGEGVSSNWTGNAANILHELMYVMGQAGSVEVKDVMAKWESLDSIETLYGPAKAGGEATYKIKNHALAVPTPISIIENGKLRFAGWVVPQIP